MKPSRRPELHTYMTYDIRLALEVTCAGTGAVDLGFGAELVKEYGNASCSRIVPVPLGGTPPRPYGTSSLCSYFKMVTAKAQALRWLINRIKA